MTRPWAYLLLNRRNWQNISKKGGLLGVGGRCATVNLNPKGHQESIGLLARASAIGPGAGSFGKPSGLANAPHGAVTVAHVVYLILIALVTFAFWPGKMRRRSRGRVVLEGEAWNPLHGDAKLYHQAAGRGV